MPGAVGDTDRMRALLLGIALAAAGCTTYHDQLTRGGHAFEQSDHDRAIAILRDIEPDFQRLTPTDQADYAYLRGMSDYQVGYKADARHWLAVARGVDEATPGALAPDRKAKVISTLNELNAIVFNDGNIANLVNVRVEPAPKAVEESADAPAPTKKKPGGKPAKPAEKPAEEPPAEVDDTAPDPPPKPTPKKK